MDCGYYALLSPYVFLFLTATARKNFPVKILRMSRQLCPPGILLVNLRRLCHNLELAKSGIIGKALINMSGTRYFKIINFPIKMLQTFTILLMLKLDLFKRATSMVSMNIIFNIPYHEGA
jgi:hypothetical protein